MNLLRQLLDNLAGGHQATPQPTRQAPIPGQAQVPFRQSYADDYNANPTADRFRNVDPMYFGYPADNGQQLRVQRAYSMQPFGAGAEDDYTPSAALERTGYFNPQTTRHGYFQQVTGNPQGDNYSLRRMLGL